MSRYIDAEWLKIALELYRAVDLSEAPSIDIVRCGECKYWKSTVQMPNGTDVKCLYGRKDDDFCSYGEQFGKTEQLKGVGKADRFGKERVDEDSNQ